MFRKIRKNWRKEMIRPFIYMVFTRAVLTLFAVYMGNFLIMRAGGGNVRRTLFLIGAFVFALFSWIAYMRMDGARLPKPFMKRAGLRKKPARSYGDMIDFVDEQPQVTYDDLEDSEKDVCILGANVFCCIMSLLLSLL